MLLFVKKSSLFIFLFFLPTLTIAASKTFVVSYVDHEGIKKHYVPLVAAAYRQIGIQTTFKQVNDQRALWLLNKGKLDAETVKTTESIEKYNDILVVPTSISTIEVLLVCQPNVHCSPEIFTDANKTIGVVAAVEFYDKQLSGATVNIKSVTSFEQLHNLHYFSRVDAIITVLDKYSKEEFGALDNFYKLEEKVGFHLIHKQHKGIMAELDKAFREVKKNPHLINPKDAID